MKTEIQIFPDLQSLNRAAGKMFIQIGNKAIRQNSRFTVSLAGGSTPKSLYRLLASDEFRQKLDWEKTFFFFGDERCVPPDSEESNFRMANEALFEPLSIKSENIFRFRAEFEPEIAAGNYENELKEFFALKNNELPRFDLILLGIGADGHTASLFPQTEALKEASRFAVANWVENFNSYRLTLTFPVINNAANVAFLVAGEEKAETLKSVLEGEFEPDKLPAQAVEPSGGNLFWLVDKEAAKLLENARQ